MRKALSMAALAALLTAPMLQAFAADPIAAGTIASANARPQCKAQAHYVTPNPGGHGAGRDAIDFILTAQGSLDRTIEQYLDAENSASASADVGSGNM